MSKFVDVTCVTQVIGNVFNNPSLLDQTDKYSINDEDFPNQFHKIVFGTLYKLYELGAEKITLKNVSDFLAERPKSEAIFQKEKGEEWLIAASENATATAFDYYYNRLKKMSLLRAYDSYGIDVSFLYDPDNILDIKKKQEQEEWLDNTSLEKIAEKVDNKIDEIKAQYIDNTFGEIQQPNEGAEELFNRLKEAPDVGVPLYGPLINTVTRGARLRKFYLRSAASGYGKAIPNDTLIPTPKGWKRVGDIKSGDYLFGQDGKSTKVLQIHPQEEKKEIYKVILADGRIAECCEDHLWEYGFKSHNSKLVYRTESVKEILARIKTLKNGFRTADNKGYRFKIKLNQPVEYPEKEYSLSPYVMGAFLGDGSFRYDKTQKGLSFSTADTEILEHIIKELGNHIIYHKNSQFNYNYTFKDINNTKHNIWVEEFLKDYPELWNTKSETKFIPKDYLEGSIQQRIELLQGLMDTDGNIDSKGRMKITTVSPLMRDNIIELCRSLGMIANYSIDKRVEKYTTNECYQISIQAKKELKPQLFRLSRKKDIAINYANSNKRNEYKTHLSIVDIIPTGEYTDMTCFTVDNESHLFLMNDFIVTHNTRTQIADVCNIGCDKIYDEMFGWISNGVAEPVLYITTEQELEEIQTMMWSFLACVNEDHILNNMYVGDEEKRVKEAIQILARSKIYIVELPDFSLQDVENVIKQNIRENGVKYIFMDYIMTSLKILSEIAGRVGGVKLREDNILFMLSRRLKDIANEYGVFVLSSTQLTSNWRECEIPDQSLLRGARSICDSIDVGYHLLPADKNDLEKLETILATNTFETPNVKLSVYKNRRGRYKGVYLWCKADLGVCRVKPMFATTWDYSIIPIEDLKILTEEKGAF